MDYTLRWSDHCNGADGHKDNGHSAPAPSAGGAKRKAGAMASGGRGPVSGPTRSAVAPKRPSLMLGQQPAGLGAAVVSTWA